MFQQKAQGPMAKIMPFIVSGVLIVLAVVGILLLSYILLWGVAIGAVLYAGHWVKTKFFGKKQSPMQNEKEHQAKVGRVFEHEDER